MKSNKPKNPLFLLALSNLFAAFGGGIILGKGIACIQTEYLKGGSVLAFFTGTVLGLIFLQSITASLSKLLTKYFSFFSSFISIILLTVFNKYSINQIMTSYAAITFFALLSIRFGFWFYSRVRRAAEAAKIQHRIAWVELGYYIGIISGLVLWKILNIPLSFSAALMIDAGLQLLAGLTDLLTTDTDSYTAKTEPHPQPIASNANQNTRAWRVITTLTTLTIATQAVLFSLAHDVSANIGTYILAVFYAGVAVAAYIFKALSIQLHWLTPRRHPTIQCNGTNFKFSFCVFILSIFVGGSIFVVKGFNPPLQTSLFVSNIPLFSFLLLVFIAAFIYELIALSVIDRVNLDFPHERYTIIIKSYGFMGIGTGAALWVLNILTNSYYLVFCILFVCVIFSTMTMTNKHNKDIA